MKTKFDFNDGNGVGSAHKHPKGGGWVADSAMVGANVYIGKDALVYGVARVYSEVQVYGEARVYGKALLSADWRRV